MEQGERHKHVIGGQDHSATGATSIAYNNRVLRRDPGKVTRDRDVKGRCLKICLEIVFARGFGPLNFCQRYMWSYYIFLCINIVR